MEKNNYSDGLSNSKDGRAGRPIIQVEGLGKRYGDFWAVKDVSFSLRPGEVFGLLGPNGAGKTTTLRIIAGLMAPSEGTVLVDGLPPYRRQIETKNKIGFLTGNTKLYAKLTPRELLKFFGRLYGMTPQQISERSEHLIKLLNIEDFADRYCGQLSTGQSQRVNIARALLPDPPILILDEPTTGLDILSSHFIIEIVQKYKENGKAILFSTHILTEAELICDRIGILHRGKLIAQGTLSQLLELSDSQTLAQAFLRLIGEK